MGVPLDSHNKIAFEFTERADAALVNHGAQGSVPDLTRSGTASFACHGQVGMGRYCGQFHQKTNMADYSEYWKSNAVPAATGNFTVLALIFLPFAVENYNDRAVWGKNYTGNAGPAGSLYLKGNNGAAGGFGFRYNGGSTSVTDVNVVAGRWNLIAATRSGSTISHHRVYLDSDGIVKGNTSATTATVSGTWAWGDSTGDLRVGSDGLLPTHNLRIARCRIDDSARTLSDLIAVMNGWATDLLGYTPPATGSDTVRADLAAGVYPMNNLGSDGGHFQQAGNFWTDNSFHTLDDGTNRKYLKMVTNSFASAGAELDTNPSNPTNFTAILRFRPDYYAGPNFTGYQEFFFRMWFGSWSAPYASFLFSAELPSSQDAPGGNTAVAISSTLTQVAPWTFEIGQEMVVALVVDVTNNLISAYKGSKLLGTRTATGFSYGPLSGSYHVCIGGPANSASGNASYIDAMIVPSALTLDQLESFYVSPNLSNPTIATVSPSTGYIGTVITLTGTEYQNGAVVYVGGNACATTFVDTEHLTAIVAEHAAGVLDVTVVNADTATVTAASAFTYTAIAVTASTLMEDFSNLDAYNRASTSFIGGGTGLVTGCFENGSGRTDNLLPIEVWLGANAFPAPALEQLRQVVLSALTDSTSPADQARTLLTTVYMTEISGVFDDMITVPTAIRNTMMCQRRRLLSADQLMSRASPLYSAALSELRDLRTPPAYLDLFREHLSSPQYKRRVAARAALVLFAALLLYRPN